MRAPCPVTTIYPPGFGLDFISLGNAPSLPLHQLQDVIYPNSNVIV